MRQIAYVIVGFLACAAFAQTKPDDTPKINLGVLVFGDFTVQTSPADFSSFNISRAYINVTGNLNHQIAFRITPDITRINDSQVFRLKYAYGQLSLDDWTTKGSWVRLGMHETPFLTYMEAIYRYRFQGSVFPERIGLMTASDTGLSAHYNFPRDLGDVHAGIYNGEGYAHAETNNEKAFEIRGTLHLVKPIRITGFVDEDHYAAGDRRFRAIEEITYEHPRVNAGLDVLQSNDHGVSKSGWSAWATPWITLNRWGLLLRRDHFPAQNRNIAGIAYWVPNLQRGSSAIMLDYDSSRSATAYGLKMMISF